MADVRPYPATSKQQLLIVACTIMHRAFSDSYNPHPQRRLRTQKVDRRRIQLSNDELHVAKAALKQFLLHGAKYAFPATFGAPTRGVPTASAPPLRDQINQPDELPPVWPSADGDRRGISFYPLYPSVPQAACKDPMLYETLALFDALRGGAARERNLAAKLLEQRFA